MSTMSATNTTQVYRVYIRTTPEAVWDAITKPEWTERYGYGGVADYDLRVGGRANALPGAAMKAYPGVPDVIIDGEFVEVDPPRRLVQTWRMLMTPPDAQPEGFTRLTYEIADTQQSGVCRLTVTHELDQAPGLAPMLAGDLEETGAGGGWNYVLSDLKSLLETGKGLAA